MIADMKPWYDNYCFAKDSLGSDPKMFNCDMVLYYLRNYIDGGKAPEQMIDPNTRTDYNKMKKLIQLDRLDGDRKGVLRRITEEGRIVADLVTTFPARDARRVAHSYIIELKYLAVKDPVPKAKERKQEK